MTQEISLIDLIRLLWGHKIKLFLGVVCGLICAFILLTVMTPDYKATMIVAPADGYALGDYASTIEHDQVATLPFWRPKANESASPDFHRFIHTLRGPSLAEILMKDEPAIAKIKEVNPKAVQSPAHLARYLERSVRIDPMGATPLRKISYYHLDRDFAAAMLRKLHLIADQMIRRDRRKQSQSRIEYLDGMLQKTLNPDHRKGITHLLMQQEHIQMLANLNEAYAAILVEPASASPQTVRPHKILTVLAGGLIGFIVVLPFISFRLRISIDA